MADVADRTRPESRKALLWVLARAEGWGEDLAKTGLLDVFRLNRYHGNHSQVCQDQLCRDNKG